jgi:hypothetical protein
LVALQLYAIAHFLYWRLLWLDTPMHVLGGLVLGEFIAGFISKSSDARIYWVILARALYRLGDF